MPQPRQNNDEPEQWLRYIQERSDDIEKAVIPIDGPVKVKSGGQPARILSVGLALHMLGGEVVLMPPSSAAVVLNEGILNRMKIRIVLKTRKGEF